MGNWSPLSLHLPNFTNDRCEFRKVPCGGIEPVATWFGSKFINLTHMFCNNIYHSGSAPAALAQKLLNK